MSDLFTEENKSTSNYFKFEKVGDAVTGVYVDKRTITNDMSETPKKQYVYTLIEDGTGQPIDVYGKGKEPQCFPGLEAAKFGQVVGLKFDGELEAKTKGYKPTKLINVYTKGEMKPEVLKKYQEGKAGISPDDIAF